MVANNITVSSPALMRNTSTTITSQHNHTHTNQTLEDQQVLVADSILTNQVMQTKLLASLVLFIITLICGYLPVRCILNQRYIQYAMFAGGGVLMATAFCHLIPEAHDNYRSFLQSSAELANLTKTHDHLHYFQHNHHSHHITPSTLNNTNISDGEPADDQPTASSASVIPYLEITLCCGFFFMYIVEQLMTRFINNHTHEHPCDTSLGQLVCRDSQNYNHGLSSTNDVHISSGSLPNASAGTEFYKFIRGFLIVSAFGAHSIFDGVAIGSQETIEKVWTIFLAISCHKLIIAAVVGLELYAATLESHLWTLVHISIFSIMSPIGIILVVVAQNSLHLDSNSPAMILLQSFATGTLLYIVFVEILQPKEGQAYEKNRFGKSFSLIAGFALMLLVLTLIGE